MSPEGEKLRPSSRRTEIITMPFPSGKGQLNTPKITTLGDRSLPPINRLNQGEVHPNPINVGI